MVKIRTNRDLYLAISSLTTSQAECERTLQVYLLALLGSAEKHAAAAELTSDQFFELLSLAFTADPPAFDPQWRERYDHLPYKNTGYQGWEATLIRQIVDLREMEECGALSNDAKFFGIDAPRGSRWYNFDPRGYLECAAAGAIGGWEQGDETGRQLLPGAAAEHDDTESMEAISPMAWELCIGFLVCGQIYE